MAMGEQTAHRRTNRRLRSSSSDHNVPDHNLKKDVWSLASGIRARVMHTGFIRMTALLAVGLGCAMLVVTVSQVGVPSIDDETENGHMGRDTDETTSISTMTAERNSTSLPINGRPFLDKELDSVGADDNNEEGVPPVISSPRRFPQYGTSQFDRECNWTNALRDKRCTFFVDTVKNGQEGLARWVTDIVTGHILAAQAGCDLLIRYGEKVKLDEVITPYDGHNWTVPTGFQCNSGWRCLLAFVQDFVIEGILGKEPKISPVPMYRFAYSGGYYAVHQETFRHIERNLNGFRIETGMACALGSLFRLVPTASKFEPRLFTTILPTLQDPTALVMALYVRTARTDQMATVEEEGPEANYSLSNHPDAKNAGLVTNCALQLEGEYLSGERMPNTRFSRVVWMVITDSPDVKHMITEKYHGQDANHNATVLPDKENVSAEATRSKLKIVREVLVTSSRGIHTRSRRDPSTADFAEALIDWYLLGESDLVINSGTYTFGATGALRTARPLFLNKCKEGVLVQG